MKKVGLFYFSGTGATKLVAGHIRDTMQRMGCEVSLYNIEHLHKREDLPDMNGFDLIGLGSPVIGFSTPRRMNQFIGILPVTQARNKVFVFRTCGGVAETNHTASHHMIRRLRGKKYEVFHERLFSIGSNWVFKFDDTIMQQLYVATKRKIDILCRQVIEGETRLYRPSVGLRLKKGFVAVQARLAFPLLGKNLKVMDHCTKCGVCMRNCPSANIRMKEEKIRFKTNCTACLRCVYGCPQKAIRFRFFSFIPLKNGYDLQRSLSMDAGGEAETNGRVPAFFARYVKDDSI